MRECRKLPVLRASCKLRIQDGDAPGASTRTEVAKGGRLTTLGESGRDARIDYVEGTAIAGKNNASGNLAHVADRIAKLVGLPSPVMPGTFNVDVGRHVPLTAVNGVITPQEYKRNQECIKLRRCRVCRADRPGPGYKAVIVRPSQHEDPERGAGSYWRRFELMSHHRLRDVLEMPVGAEGHVIVELERDGNSAPDWWDAAER